MRSPKRKNWRWRNYDNVEELSWLAHSEGESHFVRIDITQDKLTSTAIREDGTVMDKFSITKTR